MAQDPGRVFPGKRMAGQHGNVTRTVQMLKVVRVDTERGLLLVKGAVPGADGGAVDRASLGEDAGEEGGVTMELKLIDEQGQPAATLSPPPTRCSLATTTRRWSTRSSPPTRRTRGRARARRRSRGDINKSHKKPWKQKGTGRARAGQANSPLWRGGGRIFPSSPDENFTQKVNRKMYRAGIASILSQLVREDRLTVIESIAVGHAEDQASSRRR